MTTLHPCEHPLNFTDREGRVVSDVSEFVFRIFSVRVGFEGIDERMLWEQRPHGMDAFALTGCLIPGDDNQLAFYGVVYGKRG